MKKIWNTIDDFFYYHPVLQTIGIVLGTFLAIIALAVAIALPLHKADVKEYNNGNCPCGGHYEYSQAVGHKTGSTYIYVCDECGTPIEIDYIP